VRASSGKNQLRMAIRAKPRLRICIKAHMSKR
jgi:hypothetical protein